MKALSVDDKEQALRLQWPVGYRFPLAQRPAMALRVGAVRASRAHCARSSVPGATFNTLPSLKRTVSGAFVALKAR